MGIPFLVMGSSREQGQVPSHPADMLVEGKGRADVLGDWEEGLWRNRKGSGLATSGGFGKALSVRGR